MEEDCGKTLIKRTERLSDICGIDFFYGTRLRKNTMVENESWMSRGKYGLDDSWEPPPGGSGGAGAFSLSALLPYLRPEVPSDGNFGFGGLQLLVQYSSEYDLTQSR